jgi:hypothetical protein
MKRELMIALLLTGATINNINGWPYDERALVYDAAGRTMGNSIYRSQAASINPNSIRQRIRFRRNSMINTDIPGTQEPIDYEPCPNSDFDNEDNEDEII